MPEDTRAYDFYKKYGFSETDEIYYCVCQASAAPIDRLVNSVELTLDIANTHEFVFGLCQSSGRHMYEVANHYPAVSKFRVKSSCIPGGYLQFRYREGDKTATALFWSNEETTVDTITEILARGYENGFKEIEFYFRSKYIGLFAGHHVTRENIEIERKIIL
jgi:hypothetical protein